MPCFVCFSLKSECWHKSAHHLIQGSLFDWPSPNFRIYQKGNRHEVNNRLFQIHIQLCGTAALIGYKLYPFRYIEIGEGQLDKSSCTKHRFFMIITEETNKIGKAFTKTTSFCSKYRSRLPCSGLKFHQSDFPERVRDIISNLRLISEH